MQNNKLDRAKQFLPFDALKGLKDALKEKERKKYYKKLLSPDQYDELNRTICHIAKGDMVKVVYYDHDEYISKEGIVSHINHDLKTLTIVGIDIPVCDIIDIVITNRI